MLLQLSVKEGAQVIWIEKDILNRKKDVFSESWGKKEQTVLKKLKVGWFG